ncbi:hypothetical protein BCR43DRAFT_540524 [Syncephalastrum racemosum]|uniref:Neurochondrin-domain-containing protein n=1 Tax=Syncephalastrum racemosum TaxID=13706 RepID=A0A1X2HLZ4_SYNRA|nr:hypothetical protein BCR43DRAFT_540524 [Syncephalastrum racemosum]
MSEVDCGVVLPILQKLLDGVLQNTIDTVPSTADPRDDSPFERALCAAWDVCTVREYAMTAESTTDLHRLLLKIATSTRRPRTRELTLGTLASLACHWQDIGHVLMDDMDVFYLCRSILWNENDARVLLETTRFLNTCLAHSIVGQTVVEHSHLTQFLEPVPMAPSVVCQYAAIICNTLHAELLLTSLELLTRLIVYISAVVRTQTGSVDQYMKAQDTQRLVAWGAERLEEEGRGVGIGMGFNRGVAKNVMHLLWTLLAYDITRAEDCGPDMAQRLEKSMSRIVSYLHEEDEEDEDAYDDDSMGNNDDADIENLAMALNNKLSMRHD